MRDTLNLDRQSTFIQRTQAQRIRIARAAGWMLLGVLLFTIISLLTSRLLVSYPERKAEVRIFALVIPAALVLWWIVQLGAAYLEEGQRLRTAHVVLHETFPYNTEWRTSLPHLPWSLIRFLVVLGIALLWVALQTGDLIAYFAPAVFLGLLLNLIPGLILFRLTNGFIMGRFMQADYMGALRRLRMVRILLPFSKDLQSLEGNLYYYAKKADEAEASARALVAGSLNNRSAASNALVTLGYALIWQERAELALPILEAAAQVMPENPAPYSALAAFYLDQNIETQRAFEMTRHALRLIPIKTGQFANPWATLKATQARVLALLGEEDKARSALKEAENTLIARFKPAYADVYIDAGYVYKALGEPEMAVTMFNRALNADPDGIYGAEARAMLDRLPR